MGRVANVGSPDAASDSSTTFGRSTASAGKGTVTFQIGDAHLALTSFDPPLADRFWRLYGDCHVDAPAAHGSRVECVVDPLTQTSEISVALHDADPLDLGYFMETVFADRGCRRLPSADSAWQAMTSAAPPVSFRLQGQHVVFPDGSAWRALAANLAVALTLRLQRDVVYLHASGVAFDGRRGVLFVGPKGAGKTTMALNLASRSHTFLGDEIVGVRQQTAELVPVLRTISKRDGPCAQAVDDTLAGLAPERVLYPDGQPRTIVAASRLFAAKPRSARLEAVVFLAGFGPVPRLRPLPTSLNAAAKLTPVASTLWGQQQVARAFALVKLLAAVPAFELEIGPPDMTSLVIEAAFAG